MPKLIDEETRAKIVEAYLESDGATYKEIGEQFGINHNTISKIIKTELQSGNGVVPDRRRHTAKGELSDAELDDRHLEKLKKNAATYHPRTANWMECITPLHQHKMELEQKVEHKQAELDAAKQELRDFTATLRKLMEDTT